MGAGITNGIIPSGGGGGAAFRGALVQLTASEAIVALDGVTEFPWDEAVYDTDGITGIGGANPSRLTVPAGVTKIRLLGNVRWDASSLLRTVHIAQDNDEQTNIDGMPMGRSDLSRGEVSLTSAIIDVDAGDFFELMVSTSGDTDLIAANTWFAMEIIE